ncbi:MAG: cytochrome b/b6 domain-containing protein [Alphaproteobacteria bacterium]|nr:cytochrome b/b6 domain-containing protein [Alphaproteobacteria bacterium]
MRDQVERLRVTGGYSKIAKTSHWGFVALFAYGVLKQVDDIGQLRDTALLRFEILFASALLILLGARFFYMRRTQKTSLPEETPYAQKIAAKIAHLGMYISLATIALSGILIGLLYWSGFSSGILIDGAVGLHEVSVTLTYWLITVHILAAIYHRFRKDGVWDAMVPFWKEHGSFTNDPPAE